jgi:MSHA biogenesis protein MshQ
MNSSFTITAWIHTTHDWPTGGQKDMRIFTDDQNNTGGYSFSLGDGGWGYDSGGIAAGRLRFYNRSLDPVIFDSPPVIRSNTWYFVAAVTDFGANQRFISVFDAAGNKLSETAQVSTGSWGVDTGRVAIGGELDGTGEGVPQWRFKGYIDEVKVFKSPLTANQLVRHGAQRGQRLRLQRLPATLHALPEPRSAALTRSSPAPLRRVRRSTA